MGTAAPPSLAGPAGAVGVLGLLVALSVVSWGSGAEAVAGGRSSASARLVLALLVLAFLVYLLALAFARRGVALAITLSCAVAIQLVPLGAPLLLSTDAWSYWAYGWDAAHGGDPYRSPPHTRPENPAVIWMGEAWRDTTTVYGPVFTALSEPVALAAGSSPDRAAWLWKALAAAATLAAAALAALRSARPAFAVAVVGWNPVLAVHAAGGGHNDALLGALLAAALALGALGRQRAAALAWPLAVFVKWIPIVLYALAVVARRRRGERLVTGWEVGAWVALTLGATALYGLGWLQSLRPLVANAARRTEYALPSRLEQIGLPHSGALAVALVGLALALAWLVRSAAHGRLRTGLAGCALLVGTPYLAVWYLGWLVPVVAGDDDAVSLAVVLALCAYLLPQTVPH